MNIIFYAGSLNPGGGLTVAKIIIESLACDLNNNIVVYSGSKDCSEFLSDIFNQHDNVREECFFQKTNSHIRYLISKIFFLFSTIFKRKHIFISINYFIPSFSIKFVYHLNLLSFVKRLNPNFGDFIKRMDARIACRFADSNIFESKYLMSVANAIMQNKISNSNILYIGTDPIFKPSKEIIKSNCIHNILLVSSTELYKCNEVAIDSIEILTKKYKDYDWQLTIAGGQNLGQWDQLVNYTKRKSLEDNVNFIGPIKKKNLVNIMHESLCLINTSIIESFCMVAVEAMASGCPVVTTGETSMPESVGDAAVIVKVNSPEEFASEIYKISVNEMHRKSLIKKGIKHSNKFNNKIVSKKIQEVFLTEKSNKK